MWFSLALAGIEVLGDPAFRAPDGIVDAAVAPDGTATVISEHGEVVTFDSQGKPQARFQACDTQTLHTDVQLSPDGGIGVDCGDVYRVFDLAPDQASDHDVGRLRFEISMQTAAAHFSSYGLVLVGEEFVDGVTAETTAVHEYTPKGLKTRQTDGDFLDVIDAQGLVVLERRRDEDGRFLGWGLTRLGSEPVRYPTLDLGDIDSPPALSSRDNVVCATLYRVGTCFSSVGEEVKWHRADEPFLAPEQEVPICNFQRTRCFDVDRTRLRPLGAHVGIGRIEAVAADADGTHFLTRDHHNQVLHHSDKGRRLLTTTDGAIAISPSGRFAWYQTAQRSLRVELINGVRTTFPRATAAVFGTDDALYLALPSSHGNTMITLVPPNLDVAFPIFPLHDPREVTGIQYRPAGKAREALLLEFAQDDRYALLDLASRTIGEGSKSDRKPFKEHAFSAGTPLHLAPDVSPFRVEQTEAGLRITGPGIDPPHDTAPDTLVRFGGSSGATINMKGEVRTFMGAGRSEKAPGPVHDAWVTDHAIYVALRDGRLAIIQ